MSTAVRWNPQMAQNAYSGLFEAICRDSNPFMRKFDQLTELIFLSIVVLLIACASSSIWTSCYKSIKRLICA